VRSTRAWQARRKQSGRKHLAAVWDASASPLQTTATTHSWHQPVGRHQAATEAATSSASSNSDRPRGQRRPSSRTSAMRRALLTPSRRLPDGQVIPTVSPRIGGTIILKPK
jgi:hypothetical protein